MLLAVLGVVVGLNVLFVAVVAVVVVVVVVLVVVVVVVVVGGESEVGKDSVTSLPRILLYEKKLKVI